MASSRILLFIALCICATPAAAQVPAPAPGTPLPGDTSPLAQILQNTQNRLECPTADQCRLTGQVDIEISAGTRFFADEIDLFTKPTFRVVASGNVVFTGPEGRIAAERVEYNVTEGTGTFYQASGIMSLGATVDRVQFGNQDPDVYFYGETIEKISARSYRLTRGGFTTCVQPTPRWEVTSGSVIINLSDYAIARNMILRVKGVPMMYLPILYYPIKDEDRATGFLLPTYGSSTFRGQAISNAFFWAIGRSHDATFFHDWYTRTGQGVGGEYRYVAGQGSYGNVRLYHLDQHQAEFVQSGSTTVLPAQSSLQILGAGNQAIGTAIRLHQRVDYTSSVVTKQLYQQNLYQASNATSTVEAGATGSWGALTTGALFQRTETFTDADSSQLYGSTPRLTAAVAPQRLFGLPVYGSVNGEYAYLPYRQIEGGKVVSTSDKSLGRFDVLPTMRAALSRLTYLTLNTSASYRTTYYTRSADAKTGVVTSEPLTRQYLTLRSDITGPVLAKVWDTPASGYSERMKHLIEPTFALEFIPAIGNADRVLALSDSSDIIRGDSTRFTYGLNNRLLYRARTTDGSAGTTIQFLTIGVQQTYYVTERASLNDLQYVSNNFRSGAVDLSDVALNIKLTPGPRLDSTTRFEYDVHGEGLHVITTQGTVTFGASSSTINYSRYHRLKPESSMTWSSAVNVVEGRARGAYALTWDIGRSGILNQSVGVTYMAQCCGIQAEFQKFKFPQSSSNFPIPSDRRFNVSFVLAGLGTFSNFFGAFGGLTGSGY